jgi:hypothetical protein
MDKCVYKMFVSPITNSKTGKNKLERFRFNDKNYTSVDWSTVLAFCYGKTYVGNLHGATQAQCNEIMTQGIMHMQLLMMNTVFQKCWG